MLEAKTKEQKKKVLEIFGIQGTYCHFPLDFGKETDWGYEEFDDRIYLDGRDSRLPKRTKQQITNMDRKNLSLITKEEANRSLSYEDKVKWVDEHTRTANTYVIRNGMICDVEPAGWWY